MGGGGGGGCSHPTSCPGSNPPSYSASAWNSHQAPVKDISQVAEDTLNRLEAELRNEVKGAARWERDKFIGDAAQDIAFDILGDTIEAVTSGEHEQRAFFLYVKNEAIIRIDTKVGLYISAIANQPRFACYVIAISAVTDDTNHLNELRGLLRLGAKGTGIAHHSDRQYFGELWDKITNRPDA
ncbi:hypothetical protein FRC11_004320 [Ceratobasidium sp. 423]|nr:hypothetical protein FRC11_004320 [Ceratobasidium sp. 423]